MLYVYIFLFILFGEHRYLHGLTHSFPARRSSDLGHTPYVDEGEVAQQLEDGFSALAEAYSSILTNLDYSIPRDRNVLQFTSSQASEGKTTTRSEEHTSELQSLMRISYAVFCLKKKQTK